MRRLVLLFAGLLIGLTTVTATELNNQKQKYTFNKTTNYRYAQPVVFIERDIEFSIFHDGTFNFNTYNSGNNGYYKYGNTRRTSINATFNSTKSYRYSNNSCSNENSIARDRDGKIRRIGNVHLNYDRYGKITRAGDININYSRGHFGELRQVGGLHVNYNHYGEIINTYGQVNRHNPNYYNLCGIKSCRAEHNFNNSDLNYFKKKKNKKHRHADDRCYNERNYYSKRHGKSKKR